MPEMDRETSSVLRDYRSWFRLTVAVSAVTALLLLAGGRVVPLVATIRDAVAMPHSQDALFGSAALVFLACVIVVPFPLALLWLRHRTGSKTTQQRLPLLQAVGNLLRSEGESSSTIRKEGSPVVRPVDDPGLQAVRAVTIGLYFGSISWLVELFRPSLLSLVWAVACGIGMGATLYCLARARPHLSTDWLEGQKDAPVPRRTSVWPEDYDEDGQVWIRRYWIAFVVTVALWIGPFTIEQFK